LIITTELLPSNPSISIVIKNQGDGWSWVMVGAHVAGPNGGDYLRRMRAFNYRESRNTFRIETNVEVCNTTFIDLYPRKKD